MIVPTQFQQKYPNVSKELDQILAEGEVLGSKVGTKRVKIIREHYRQFPPDTVYDLADFEAIQDEIETYQSRTAHLPILYIARNCFSIAPLILTWTALGMAVNSYQQDITAHPNDKTQPFLTLWQGGFNNATWFTFTFTAILDVILLGLYLVSILWAHHVEHKAREKGQNYVQELWDKLNEFVELLAKEQPSTYVTKQSDIDLVIDSINKANAAMQQTVGEMTNAVKQTVDDTTQTMRQYLDQAWNTTQTTMQQLEQSLKQALSETQGAMKQALSDTQGTMQQTLSNSQGAMQQVLSDTQGTMKQAIDASQQSVENVLKQQVTPLITTFHQDIGTLQAELKNYQGRLDTLTDAAQKIAQAGIDLSSTSGTLKDNAEQYVTIGKDIGTQINALNRTQQDVLTQITTVANSMSTTAGQMFTAANTMAGASKGVEAVTHQVDSGMRNAIQQMTAGVEQTTRSLTAVSQSLHQTVVLLREASDKLSKVAYPSNNIKTFVQRMTGKLKPRP